ncbi:MAG: 4-vinyl reductase [Candidatus Nealsonbacteria bacterium]|nr:4-vinyl reductase [Candidatus Nealsonbacteria bacterium]
MEKEERQKVADQIMSVHGNARGDLLLSTISYIKQREGDNGLKDVENELKRLGYPIDFNNIERLKWYPKSVNILIYFLCTEIFKWGKEDIFELGRAAVKLALITRVIAKYFISVEKMFEQAPSNWDKYVDFGSAETVEVNNEKRYGIVRIHGYNFHPVGCYYLEGFFIGMLDFVVQGKKEIEETKCVHKGDSYHEFILRW